MNDTPVKNEKMNPIEQYGKDDPRTQKGRIMRKIIYPFIDMPDECIAIFHRKGASHTTLPSLTNIKQRQNNYCTLFFFIRGHMNMIVDKATVHATNGNVFFLSEETPHRTYTFNDGVIEYFGMDISSAYIKSLKGKHFLYDLFYNSKQKSYGIHNISDIEKIIDRFKLIERNQNESDLLLYSYVIQTLHTIHDTIKTSAPMHSPSIINTATEYMSENFRTIRSISEIARYCNVNTSHLCTTFRQKLDCSVNELLKRFKFQNSIELILSGKSPEDAAYESGFPNYKYYQSLFKKYYGITPKKYLSDLNN
ncbi:MAG: helix-turn-helix transcriptional regulator [Clostridia bacterium]|nr:helix-turn-helix transcriptional regulator [Clostridia bacterium]